MEMPKDPLVWFVGQLPPQPGEVAFTAVVKGTSTEAGSCDEAIGILHQMQGAVTAGVMEMDKFSDQVRRSVGEVGAVGGKLGTIIERVQGLTERFRVVTEGMKSQAQGARQINEAMGSLQGNVQTSARSLGEFTAAADQMRGAVDGLSQELSKFQMED